MRVVRIGREGLQALASNRLRTFFMMAGTVVGIAAITVIMAIGAGTERTVMERVGVFGFRAIMVLAGGGSSVGSDAEVATLQMRDVEVIRSQVDGVAAMSPTINRGGMTVRAGAVHTRAMVFAVEPDWHEAWDWHVQQGDAISAEDMSSLARVCVVGTSLARELFGDANPVGQYVQIGNVRFLVNGVLESKGSSPMGSDMDNRALIPLTTGMRRLFNQEHLSQIRLKVKDPDQLVAIADNIRSLLRQLHQITPAEEDDFRVRSAADIAEFVRGVSGALSALLTALAALSLIVGGIVLMNILLISVSERTKEIALRRALGATQGDIFTQFLSESLATTLLGMFIGSMLGGAIGGSLAAFTEFPVVISWQPFGLAVMSALLVGLVFGVQPARRAARLNPAGALQ